MPFSNVEKESRKPPAMIQVPPSAWAAEWPENPGEPVMCGLRPLSEADLIFANGEAVKEALLMYPPSMEGCDDPRNSAYHDAQMRYVVSRGTCDPNDVTKPWEFWGKHGGDGVVQDALTMHGLKMLWDAIERVTIETSPVEPEATDADIQELLTKAPDALAAMPQWQAARVRRLLHWCLNAALAAKGEVTDG